jgi:putative RNA 2'-phosphotransferase
MNNNKNNNDKTVSISKFLSLVLRHEPEAIGLTLDANGWADIEELMRLANAKGKRLTRELIEQVVADNDKQRFIISDDGKRMRANQGHSVNIDLALEPQVPPDILYHGTATRFVESVRQQGLSHRERQHVHLSLERATALNVGTRHGKPIILEVAAKRMHEAGFVFYISANDVWLTDNVPASYITIPEN